MRETSAPYFADEIALLTQFAFGRYSRVRSKRVLVAELAAAQGDV